MCAVAAAVGGAGHATQGAAAQEPGHSGRQRDVPSPAARRCCLAGALPACSGSTTAAALRPSAAATADRCCSCRPDQASRHAGARHGRREGTPHDDGRADRAAHAAGRPVFRARQRPSCRQGCLPSGGCRCAACRRRCPASLRPGNVLRWDGRACSCPKRLAHLSHQEIYVLFSPMSVMKVQNAMHCNTIPTC